MHTERFDALATLLNAGEYERANETAAAFRAEDGPFGHLDARSL
jgi:1,4-alpha-glucan branching enzyme